MPNTREAYGLPILASGYLWACAAVFAIMRLSGVAVNHFFYSAIAEVFGPAREIATLLGAAVYATFALLALRNPGVLHVKAITLLSAISFIAFGGLLIVADYAQATALFVLALLFRTIASASLVVLFGFCLLKLETLTRVVAVIAFGFLINYLVTPFVYTLSSALFVAVCMMAAGVLAVLFCGHFAQDDLERVRISESASDMELDDPWSFVQPSHLLFLCVLFFHTATGFALTFGEVENAPAQITLEGFAIVFLVLYFVFVRDMHQEDTLFSFAVLLVTAGLLIAPLTIQMDAVSVAPNTLIRFGGDCFTILLWLVIVGIGRRNLFGMLPVLGFSHAYGSIGTTLGAIAGHATNDYVANNSLAATAVCMAIVFAFVAFLWIGFRSFSFTKTINGIQELSVEHDKPFNGQREEVPDNNEESTSDTIALRCSELAAEYGLTPRETEIFEMLARGRNGRFIMEHYVISRNTTKSHIKHIYAKLGVHSHQELIDLVQ